MQRTQGPRVQHVAQGVELVHPHLKRTELVHRLKHLHLGEQLTGTFHRIRGIRGIPVHRRGIPVHRTDGFHWQRAKLFSSMRKGAGEALAAVTLGLELKAQLRAQQTGRLSQLFRRVCEMAFLALAATIRTPVLAHLGELPSISGLLAGHLGSDAGTDVK